MTLVKRQCFHASARLFVQTWFRQVEVLLSPSTRDSSTNPSLALAEFPKWRGGCLWMFHDELTVDVLTVAPWSGPHAIGFFGKSDRHIGHWSDVLKPISAIQKVSMKHEDFSRPGPSLFIIFDLI